MLRVRLHQTRVQPGARCRRRVRGIVAGWIDNKDEPGDYTFEGRPLVYADGVGVIQGLTTYADGRVYANLWVIHFAEDGRAKSFVEWYVEPK